MFFCFFFFFKNNYYGEGVLLAERQKHHFCCPKCLHSRLTSNISATGANLSHYSVTQFTQKNLKSAHVKTFRFYKSFPYQHSNLMEMML